MQSQFGINITDLFILDFLTRRRKDEKASYFANNPFSYIFDGSYYNVFKSHYLYTDGEWGWRHPSSLSDYITYGSMNAFIPQVAMSDNGTAIIAWQQSDGINNRIFTSEYK